MDKQFLEYLSFAKTLAGEAGKIMLRYFNADDIGTVRKDDATPLTIADTAINDMVIERVNAAYPEHGVLGEEASTDTHKQYLWVCDPIDGTFPFSHGAPISTFSLALCKDGVQQVAVLYDPYMDRMVTAIKGQGAWLNDMPFKLEEQYDDIGHQGLNIEVWTGSSSSLFAKSDLRVKLHQALEQENYLQLYYCSVAYSGILVATGKLTGLTISGGSAWDVAALDLIIREAGGVVSDCFGSFDQQDFSRPQTKGIIAARNEAEYNDFAAKIVPVYTSAERR